MDSTNTKIHVRILKLNDNAIIPEYSKKDDACMDISAVSFEYDIKRKCYIYHTGLAVDIPKNYEMQIRPRSSIRDYDIYLANSPGTVDCGYHGEVMVCFKNCFSIIDRIKLSKTNSLINKLVSSNFKVDDETKALCESLEIVTDDEILKYATENAPFKVGNRIAQIKITSCPRVSFNEVTSFSESERGLNGFGSTGE